MAFRTRGVLISGIAVAFAAGVGIPLAVANESTVAAAADLPPYAVEDYSYPGAAQILATQGIALKKGNGRILLAECDASSGQIKVHTVRDSSSGRKGVYCFQATAKTGYVTLELPRVFALETADHPISAQLTANGSTTTVEVAKGGFEGVGEGNEGGPQSVLLEIRVTG
ncbi:hypothetical protein [Streptomyces sp. NPDC047097]|uniref:hypothetical protein n=1 Tax=Streptomyces sp. NPDC047097 TaxID=3155260 RepID=UPI0033E3A969